MVKKKNGHGGVRPGSGRKKLTDKKEALFLYVEGSVIDANGGAKDSKTFAVAALRENATKLQR